MKILSRARPTLPPKKFAPRAFWSHTYYPFPSPYSPPAELVPLLPGPSTTEDRDAQAPSVPAPPLDPVSGRRPEGDPAAWMGDGAAPFPPSLPLVVVAPPPLPPSESLTDEVADADVPVVVLLLPPPLVPAAVILLLFHIGVG